LKIRELNAIIFCLDKVVNGEMFDDWKKIKFWFY
jgi:hypothetical protein